MEPSDVTASPTSDAPEARKAAQPSVVPARTRAPATHGQRDAQAARTGPSSVPTGSTRGRRATGAPTSASQSGQARATGS